MLLILGDIEPEDALAREEILKHAPQRPYVNRVAVLHIHEQLGRFEPRRPTVALPLVLDESVQLDRVVEVGELDDASVVPKHVGRLDVPVNEILLGVQVLEALGQLLYDALDLFGLAFDSGAEGQFLQIMLSFIHFDVHLEIVSRRIVAGHVREIVVEMSISCTRDVGVVELAEQHQLFDRMMVEHRWDVTI